MQKVALSFIALVTLGYNHCKFYTLYIITVKSIYVILVISMITSLNKSIINFGTTV